MILRVFVCRLGGYVTHTTKFYPQDGSMEPFSVVLFTATSENELWLGDAPLEDIAEQCVECFGKTGHNIEYVLKLAEWARATFPEVEDKHLYGLEKLIRGKAEKKGLVVENMGLYSIEKKYLSLSFKIAFPL